MPFSSWGSSLMFGEGLGKCVVSFTFSASFPERTSLTTCCSSIWSEIVEGSEMVCVWGFFPPNEKIRVFRGGRSLFESFM